MKNRMAGRMAALGIAAAFFVAGMFLFSQDIRYPANGNTPGGAAGGDLSGTYPNPTVAQVNGAAVPASASLVGTNSSNQLVASLLTGPAVAAKAQATIAVTTPSSDVLCAKAGDTSNSLVCNNGSTDDTTAYQYFASTYTIPASLWAQGRILQACAQFANYSTNTTPTVQYVLAYGAGNTALFSILSNTALHASNTNNGMEACWQIVAASATSVFTSATVLIPTTSALSSVGINATAQPVSIGASSQSLQIGWQWSTNTGLHSATYVSGGSFSGTGTCTLGTFNNGLTSGAANIAVSSGTPGAITITNTGYGATSAPTSATVTSGGGATCSGTPTLSSVLGGAQGNQIVLQSLTISILN